MVKRSKQTFFINSVQQKCTAPLDKKFDSVTVEFEVSTRTVRGRFLEAGLKVCYLFEVNMKKGFI